ncbi:hypothetical protein K1X84_13665 [bacterium]|nr:hypothetical protein [bacterium]
MSTKWLTWILVVAILSSGCRKRHVGDQFVFHKGFYGIPWGASVNRIDSLTVKDTTFKKISRVVNMQTGGSIIVVQRNQRDYYLEFDTNDRLFYISYIALYDQQDLDSVQVQLLRNYGKPDKDEHQDVPYDNKFWNISVDSTRLEIQLLITDNSYSLKVTNFKKPN